ncbi:MAG: hypothetical protein JO061_06935 [Acidobacteriaceae bacterium]|nr:hypothetical protein [Acidobacteriaceae bacterium]
MLSLNKHFNETFFTRRAVTLAAVVFLGIASTPAFAQYYRFNPEHRRPVEATLHDLQDIGSYTANTGERDRERFTNAIHHLQQFGERLHERGYFDKDKLDQAIGDVQNIIDHNRLPDRGRDVLFRDVTQLRSLRQHFDDTHYHYPY